MKNIKSSDKDSHRRYIDIFNSTSELHSVRERYKNNFDLIVLFIKKYGYDLALVDISEMDINIKQIVNELNLEDIN